VKRSELKRKTPLHRSSSLNRGKAPQKRRKGVSPASREQRDKIKGFDRCAFCGRERSEWLTLDPAHLCARGNGGCSDALCVVPACRGFDGSGCHRSLDEGGIPDAWQLLRPYHDERRWLPEIQHALDHYDGDVFGLLHRLTGLRFVPDERKAA
jgi:hypothetical protein